MNNEFDDINEIAQLIDSAKKTVSKKKAIKKISKQLTVTQPQLQFLNFINDNTKEEQVELCASGGVGAGKSYALCLMLLKYIQEPNTTVLLVHQYFSMLRKTTLRLLLQSTVNIDGTVNQPLLPPEFIQNFNKTNGVIVLHNGSQIILTGCQDEEKLKSLNISAAFIDEVTHLSKEAYQSIVQRCRVFHKYPNGVFCVCNPSTKASWTYKHFAEDPIPGYREMLTIDSRSNKANLPASYIKNLERLPELERKRMLEGNWINTGSDVFYTFDRNIHVKYLDDWQKSNYQDFILAVDLGGGGENAYSGACLIGQTHNAQYHTLEIFNKTKTTHKEMLDFLEKYRHLTNIVVNDSANACFKSDLDNHGWTIINSIKDIEGSIAKCNSLLKDDRIIISSKCDKLIKQIEDATRDPETNKIYKLKDFDLIDAWRYAMCALDDSNLIDKNTVGNVFVFAL